MNNDNRRVFMTMVGALALVGCATVPEIPPLGSDHPASPQAAAAPVPPRSLTLDPAFSSLSDERDSMNGESDEHRHHQDSMHHRH